MWPGLAAPQEEHLFSFGACQRLACRRIFCLLLDFLRFGQAMIYLRLRFESWSRASHTRLSPALPDSLSAASAAASNLPSAGHSRGVTLPFSHRGCVGRVSRMSSL